MPMVRPLHRWVCRFSSESRSTMQIYQLHCQGGKETTPLSSGKTPPPSNVCRASSVEITRSFQYHPSSTPSTKTTTHPHPSPQNVPRHPQNPPPSPPHPRPSQTITKNLLPNRTTSTHHIKRNMIKGHGRTAHLKTQVRSLTKRMDAGSWGRRGAGWWRWWGSLEDRRNEGVMEARPARWEEAMGLVLLVVAERIV